MNNATQPSPLVEWVRRRRADGATYKDLAAELGVPHSSIRNWAIGDIRPSRLAEHRFRDMMRGKV